MTHLRELRVLILSHYFTYGPAYDWEWYLRDKVSKLTLMEVPLYIGKECEIRIRDYDNNSRPHVVRFIKSTNHIKVLHMEELIRLAHYFCIILQTLISNEEYDIVIAQDPITTLIGVGLRKLGKVRKVIFQTHSYTAPARSTIYRFLDYYATRKSDVIWALSEKLANIRRALGAKTVIHTPVCIRDDVLEKALSIQMPRENNAIYIGSLSKDKGVDLLLCLLPDILRIFDKLYVIGKGPYEYAFKKLHHKYKNRLVFLGPKSLATSLLMARRSIIGFVLSRPSIEVLTTDPMKPKVYLAAETPVLMPNYIELATKIVKYQAGIVVKSLSPGNLRTLLRNIDTESLLNYIKGAENLARDYSHFRCSLILSRVMKATLEFLNL